MQGLRNLNQEKQYYFEQDNFHWDLSPFLQA